MNFLEILRWLSCLWIVLGGEKKSFEENKDRWIIHEGVAWVSSIQTSCNTNEHLSLQADLLERSKARTRLRPATGN